MLYYPFVVNISLCVIYMFPIACPMSYSLHICIQTVHIFVFAFHLNISVPICVFPSSSHDIRSRPSQTNFCAVLLLPCGYELTALLQLDGSVHQRLLSVSLATALPDRYIPSASASHRFQFSLAQRCCFF